MPPSISPEIITESGVTVVALGAEYENLDEHTLDSIRDALLDVSRTADPPCVLLDLSHTKFFGSSFIEVLFRLWNRLQGREGGRFAISGLTPYCSEVLTITHLDTLWPTFGTRAEAVQSLCAAARR
jgi:anti-anti-sigma factor